MPRAGRILLVLAGLALVTYLLVSLYLPSSRWLVFGVDMNTGAVRTVESRVTFLPPNRFYRLKFEKREGFAQRDGLIRITSKEGVPVTLQYRLRFSIEGDHLPDAQRMVNDGWNAWIRARVSEAVSAVTQQVPIEDLLSPTSQFNTQRDPLRRTVAAHLAQSGLKVTAFEIARFDVDRDALLRAKRTELRRDARSAPGRVAIFALDGADWELISELADDSRLPNLKALAQGGTTASVQSIQPMVSPMLWTTVATGLPPDRHRARARVAGRAALRARLRPGPALPQHHARGIRQGREQRRAVRSHQRLPRRAGEDVERSPRGHQSLQRRAAAQPRSAAGDGVVRRHRRRQSPLLAVPSAVDRKSVV